jgi:quinol monooxygenase YgiN
MEVLVAEFTVPLDRMEAWKQVILPHAERCRTLEPGCLQFDVCQDPQDPTRWLFYEVYKDAAAVDAHRNAAHFPLYFEPAQKIFTERKVRRFTRLPR